MTLEIEILDIIDEVINEPFVNEEEIKQRVQEAIARARGGESRVA